MYLYKPSCASPAPQRWVHEDTAWVPGGAALHPKLAHMRSSTGLVMH